MISWSADYTGLDTSINNKYITACFLLGFMIAKVIISGISHGHGFSLLHNLIHNPSEFNKEEKKWLYILPCIGSFVAISTVLIISSSNISMFDEEYFKTFNSILFIFCLLVCYRLTGSALMLTVICLTISTGIYAYDIYQQKDVNGIHFMFFICYFFIIIGFL
jgi:hypothetical protein